MKSKLFSLISAVCLVAFVAGIAKAATTGSVPVSASIAGVATLTITANLLSGAATDQIRLGALASATTDNWTTAGVVAPAYATVTYDDNGVWEIKIYTNNFATTPSTTTWAFQYGALKGSVAGNKIPLAWQAEEAGGTPARGNPSVPASGWLYVKDKWDVNDPATPLQDESWAAAAGYTNVAYGSALYANYVDPAVPLGTATPIIDKNFKVYVQALPFANADSYSTALGFDLINK